ncbi:glycosyl transferase family 2 [Halobacteriales archaeon QS_1_68_17]|nr:MAG: glycosyl transferase family 2 [Halobacteriales archaeon QS_1_68_17]
MEYVQERVATLHDFGDARPAAPTDEVAVVVPVTEREHASLAAERVFSELERAALARVVVPLRAHESDVGTVARWLDGFDLPLELLWCNAPGVREVLAEAGLNGPAGKGRDVWLALGVAARHEYVVVHDADATTYTADHVRRLAFPLTRGFDFVKGYYARVENRRLYGRLFRLFYAPLLRALDARHDDPIVDYLGAFRYALAGEFAVTGELAARLRSPPDWGLEVGTLGDAFDAAGFAGSAQVDLGVHEHDHRAVSGSEGLTGMCDRVADALFRVLTDHGVAPDYERLRAAYRESAAALVEQYAADAAFNGLTYDRAREREQCRAYESAIGPPGDDDRLPAWRDADLSPDRLRAAARESLADATDDAGAATDQRHD